VFIAKIFFNYDDINSIRFKFIRINKERIDNANLVEHIVVKKDAKHLAVRILLRTRPVFGALGAPYKCLPTPHSEVTGPKKTRVRCEEID
jgi:hypothetical protein